MSLDHLPTYATTHERPVIHDLIDAILSAGNSVSIHDGEEWAVNRSTNKAEILEGMATTGEDTVRARSEHRQFILGSFHLIYNNGSDHDPMIVIADHSETEYCNGIWESLNAKHGR